MRDRCGSHQVPGRTAAWSQDESLGGRDWPWTVAERDWNEAPGLFQFQQPRLRFVALVPQARMSVSPARSLAGLRCSLTVAGRAGVKSRALSVSPTVYRCVSRQVPVPARRLKICGWKGQELSLRPFRISGGTDGRAFCWVPVPAGLSGACGWDELDPVSGHFQNLQSERVWWAYVQGLLGSG